jgi:hypothetical protein
MSLWGARCLTYAQDLLARGLLRRGNFGDNISEDHRGHKHLATATWL